MRNRDIRKYFSAAEVRKIQLGAGANCLRGWLNTEAFVPSSFTHRFDVAKGYVFLDACEPFPFEDASVEYIFHEHLIEHLTFQQGQSMLKECFRVLKPGGRIRVATPDLEVFVGLYRKEASAEQVMFTREYVRFNSEVWSKDLCHVRNNYAVFVLNHNFRAWGHQFIYDYATLVEALDLAGFAEMERQQPGKSRDPNLTGLEYRKDMVGLFDALIVEGKRPLMCAHGDMVKDK